MNRYARVPVALGDPALESLRVSGVFESQSVLEFAQSIAALHHLQIERQENALILTRTRRDDKFQSDLSGIPAPCVSEY